MIWTKTYNFRKKVYGIHSDEGEFRDEQIKANGLIVDRLDQLKDAITDQHTVQTEATRKAISGLHGRLNPIENDIKDMKSYLRLETQNNTNISNTTH